ncbi:MAG: efflux RND transporter periplasmic adaptor subunit [bacterium]
MTHLKKYYNNLKKFTVSHKVWSVIIVLAIAYVGYYAYGKIFPTVVQTKYVVSTVEKTTIVSTVTGTGQVTAQNQVDIKSKVSGDVVYLGGVLGQSVYSGQLLVQLEDADAQKAVRDAQASLEISKLSLDKVLAPASTSTLLQAENSLTQAKISLNNAVGDLDKSYDDSFNAISNAFLDVPGIMAGLDGILHDSDIRTSSENVYAYADSIIRFKDDAYAYRDDAISKYQAAKDAYDKNFTDYKNISRTSATSTIESVLKETYNTVKLLADSVKSMNNLIDLYQNVLTDQKMTVPAVVSSQLNTLNSYTGKTNSHVSALLGMISSIQSAKDAIDSANRTLAEKEQSLVDLQTGAAELDIKSSQLSLTQKENALIDAQTNLADYYIRAPFAGTLAKVSVNKGDSISSGAAVATVITKQKIAAITLNEVDAAKVKVGQKVTLTFDAIDNLTVTGEVAEVDTIGTVSQGVVNYTIKVSFDTQEDSVKPGMSVSASIITAVKTDILAVPNGAIKTQGGTNYVLIPTETIANATSSQGVVLSTAPSQQTVTIGLSNDTMTEIVSGLKEGDLVVVKTTASTASNTVTANKSGAASLLGGGGAGRVNLGR